MRTPVRYRDAPKGLHRGRVRGAVRVRSWQISLRGGFADINGDTLQQGLILCGLMDAGLNRQNAANQFAAANPALGPDSAAQVVGIAIRDLCPWHR
jgi:Protein of unknown function (DUF732)